MSGTYSEIGYEINQLDWYFFPFKVWKILPMIMMNAQKQVKFECFGTISCDRETFKNVCNLQEFLYVSQYLKRESILLTINYDKCLIFFR